MILTWERKSEMSMQNFHTEITQLTQEVNKKKEQLRVQVAIEQSRKNKKCITTEASSQLPIIKKRIREAAHSGVCYIDLFPTGALGDALLELLGSGFRADTATQSLVGLSDGQGWYEGPYIPHTRLLW